MSDEKIVQRWLLDVGRLAVEAEIVLSNDQAAGRGVSDYARDRIRELLARMPSKNKEVSLALLRLVGGS